MPDLEDLRLDEIVEAVTLYRNLADHRHMVLEPVRRIASRNMAGVSRAQHCAGKPPSETSDDASKQEWVSRVQAAQLEEQGVEHSGLNGSLLESATFSPVRLYFSLFYAEIEYYWKHCVNSRWMADNQLVAVMKEGETEIGYLEALRDTFVHPQAATAEAEGEFLRQQLQYWVPAFNMAFDEGLERARRAICEHLKDLLNGLSAPQQAGCQFYFYDLASKHWFWGYDMTSLEALEKLGNDLLDWSTEWRSVPEALKPNERQLDNAHKWAMIMRELIPFRPPTESAETDHRSPAFEVRILNPVAYGFEMAKGMSGRLRGKAGRRLESNVGYYLRNLITVSVLMNEARYTVGERAEGILNSQLKSGGSSKPLDMPEREKREVAGLAKVKFALLVGMLKDYEKVVQTNEWMAIPELDGIVGHGITEASVKDFRNAVFHVIGPEVDPEEMEAKVVKQDLPALLEPLLLGLCTFVGVGLRPSWEATRPRNE